MGRFEFDVMIELWNFYSNDFIALYILRNYKNTKYIIKLCESSSNFKFKK